MFMLAQTTKSYFSFRAPYSRRKGDSNMRYCPECGGEMKYISVTKRYVCKSCGISLTHQELIELRQQLRPGIASEEEQRQKQRKEYLKWWLSKKK